MLTQRFFLTLALLSFILAASPACKSPQPQQAEPVAEQAVPLKEEPASPAEPQAAQAAEVAEAGEPEEAEEAQNENDGQDEDEDEFPWWLEKIGPLQGGQSTAQVEELLGKAPEVEKEEFSPATGEYTTSWRYKDKGVALTFRGETKGGAKTLSSISLFPPSTLKTSHGISIGDTRAEVEAAYAEADETYDSNEGRVVIGSIYGGLNFTIEDGRVRYIFLGSSAE